MGWEIHERHHLLSSLQSCIMLTILQEAAAASPRAVPGFPPPSSSHFPREQDPAPNSHHPAVPPQAPHHILTTANNTRLPGFRNHRVVRGGFWKISLGAVAEGCGSRREAGVLAEKPSMRSCPPGYFHFLTPHIHLLLLGSIPSLTLLCSKETMALYPGVFLIPPTTVSRDRKSQKTRFLLKSLTLKPRFS